jgi:uncharacterized protein YbjT (DUF2867 family)
MPELIAVIGATGNQGGGAARRLLAAGRPVRALVRDPDKPAARELSERGAELVRADLDDRASLDAALVDAHGLFSVQNFWEHGAEVEVRQGLTLHDAALGAGVRHIVFSSVGGADQQSGVSHFESKWVIEEHLRSLGVRWTIFRPSFLMENFNSERYRATIGNGVLPFGLSPDRKLQMIASDDAGAFAALAFERPDEFAGRAMDTACDELTPTEVCAAFSEALGKPVQQMRLPIEKLRELRADMAEMFEWLEAVGYRADVGACRDLHPTWSSLGDWIRKTDWVAGL